MEHEEHNKLGKWQCSVKITYDWEDGENSVIASTTMCVIIG